MKGWRFRSWDVPIGQVREKRRVPLPRKVFHPSHKNCAEVFGKAGPDSGQIARGERFQRIKKRVQRFLSAPFFVFSQTTGRNRSSCLFWCCTRTFSRSCRQWHTRWRNQPSLHHPEEQRYIQQRKVHRRRQEQEETFSSDSPFLPPSAAVEETNRNLETYPRALIKAGIPPISTGFCARSFRDMPGIHQNGPFFPHRSLPAGSRRALRDFCKPLSTASGSVFQKEE